MFSVCCLMLSLDCGSEFKDIFVNTVGIVGMFPLLVSGYNNILFFVCTNKSV